MKLKLILVYSVILLLGINAFASSGHKYKFNFTINGWQHKVCYFGFYYGENPYISLNKQKKKDSAVADAKGSFEFTGDSVLPAGVYFAITKDNKQRIEFIIDKEQQFSIQSDTTEIIGDAKVKGSEENTLFYSYQTVMAAKYKDMLKYRQQRNRPMADSINREIKRYGEDFAQKHPDMLISKILKAGIDPDIPPAPKLANGRTDSTFQYRYYKNHYFDNIDFTDGRLVHSPVLAPKIKLYLDRLTYPTPDSIIAAADYMISRAITNKDMFKFLVVYIMDKYDTSKIMGMEKIFVHMATKYYTPDKAYWVSASQLEKIRDRAAVLAPTLLGEHAPSLALPDSENVLRPMDSIKANYTILYFWDYDCGHCQKETPKLIKWYDSIKGEGVEVYAVEENEKDVAKWKEYVRKNKLDWINVSDLFNTGTFRTQYDVQITPTIYVLDENKNIIAKKIDEEDLNKVIKHDRDRKSGNR